jgi:Zn-dependent protease
MDLLAAWTGSLPERLLWLIPIVLSLTVHEWAHAWVAFQLGDETAFRQGRMTLDPFAHLDPLGTVVLPLLGIPFGWAKPVPIEPLRFDAKVPMRAGLALAAAAGPISNVLLALVCVLVLRLAGGLGWSAEGSALHGLLTAAVTVNLSLAVFNLLPIPPLDGSRIVEGLVQDRARALWSRFAPVGTIGLVGIVVVAQMGTGFVGALVAVVRAWVDR